MRIADLQPESQTFDRLIIGSSPIAIMHAVHFARRGEKVGLIESDLTIGGAWKKIRIDGVGETECACHLIEFYGKAYRLIEDLLGLEFIPLDPQPIKIFPDGRIKYYTTRLDVLKAVTYQWVVMLASLLTRIIPTRRVRRSNLSSKIKNAYFILINKVLPLRQFKGIEGPRGGYEAFAERLHLSLAEHNVQIILGRAASVSSNKFRNVSILLEDDRIISARYLYISQSTQLKGVPEEVASRKYSPKPYWHLVVSTEKVNICNSFSYIHLPHNPIFHRIASLQPAEPDIMVNNRQCFLVQTRVDPATLEDLDTRLVDLLCRCRVFKSCVAIRIHRALVENFVDSDMSAQFTPGKYGTSIHVMKTIGDLARCVLLNPTLSE